MPAQTNDKKDTINVSKRLDALKPSKLTWGKKRKREVCLTYVLAAQLCGYALYDPHPKLLTSMSSARYIDPPRSGIL